MKALFLPFILHFPLRFALHLRLLLRLGVLLTLSSFLFSCDQSQSKLDVYEMDGVQISYPIAWSFSGDTDLYWAADRVISLESEYLSAYGLFIFNPQHSDYNNIDSAWIKGKVLPRFLEEFSGNPPTLEEEKKIKIASHEGEFLLFRSKEYSSNVYLFDSSKGNKKAFSLFIIDDSEHSQLKPSIQTIMDSLSIK